MRQLAAFAHRKGIALGKNIAVQIKPPVRYRVEHQRRAGMELHHIAIVHTHRLRHAQFGRQ
ncbi:MAG TPA: hypothetical protein DEQ83_08135, partial [Rhodobiaceae bacterium]|nr:hypothetical protein [Rhodobiaceae bacterium]